MRSSAAGSSSSPASNRRRRSTSRSRPRSGRFCGNSPSFTPSTNTTRVLMARIRSTLPTSTSSSDVGILPMSKVERAQKSSSAKAASSTSSSPPAAASWSRTCTNTSQVWAASCERSGSPCSSRVCASRCSFCGIRLSSKNAYNAAQRAAGAPCRDSRRRISGPNTASRARLISARRACTPSPCRSENPTG